MGTRPVLFQHEECYNCLDGRICLAPSGCRETPVNVRAPKLVPSTSSMVIVLPHIPEQAFKQQSKPRSVFVFHMEYLE